MADSADDKFGTDRFAIEVPQPPRVAVVDDDPHLRMLIATTLRRRGLDPQTFVDGQDALDHVRKGGFDLVVSDVNMPRLDGIGMTRALRELFDKRKLPIVLVSVLDEEDDVLRAYEAGANDYITKPFGPAVLAAKVQSLLRPPAAPDLPVWREGGPLPARLDKWVIDRELGGGGNGTVFQAGKVGDATKVAIKILHPRITRDRLALARYFREVATLREIASPHVVKFIEAGHANERHFLVMELVPGRTALTALQADGVLPFPTALRACRDVARALGALLERGLVHRDVKPANIMIRPDGVGVLVDFGLAKRPGEAMTSSHDVIGTPEFIPPEVIRGDLPDSSSDIYALGATLYQLLGGEPPVTAATGYDVLVRVVRGDRGLPLDMLRPDVPKDIDAYVKLLLEPDPRKRPSDPADVAAKLDALAAKHDR